MSKHNNIFSVRHLLIHLFGWIAINHSSHNLIYAARVIKEEKWLSKSNHISMKAKLKISFPSYQLYVWEAPSKFPMIKFQVYLEFYEVEWLSVFYYILIAKCFTYNHIFFFWCNVLPIPEGYFFINPCRGILLKVFTHWCHMGIDTQDPLLLTWFNFNHSMDKQSHAW